jgi:mannose-6-phosphate isomerase-like protein (cupin superfamily)
MKETIKRFNPRDETFIAEGCFIVELSNTADDPDISIARARVAPGVTTRWHRLVRTVERYVILEGQGRVEIGSLSPQDLKPGDVALIPSSCRQRVTNTSQDDLVFLAICSPRFTSEAYEDIDGDSPGGF